MKSRGLFVIGTDTGVGKTFVSLLLLKALRKQGVKVSAMKPFECGQALPADTDQLWEAMGGKSKPPHHLCPFRFREPLAPAQAARQEKSNVSLAVIDQAFEQCLDTGDFVLVEGCGGLLVPLLPQDPRWTVEDLALRFNLPILIVARAGLGTLNHSLLTLYRCRAVQLPVMGLVLNHVTPPNPSDVSIESNSGLLSEITEIPIWGPLPNCKEIRHDKDKMIETIVNSIMEKL